MENHKIYQKNMSFTARCLMRCLPFGAISLRNNRTAALALLILERKLRCVSAAAFKKQLSSNQTTRPGRGSYRPASLEVGRYGSPSRTYPSRLALRRGAAAFSCLRLYVLELRENAEICRVLRLP